jgi:hypothetical protein
MVENISPIPGWQVMCARQSAGRVLVSWSAATSRAMSSRFADPASAVWVDILHRQHGRLCVSVDVSLEDDRRPRWSLPSEPWCLCGATRTSVLPSDRTSESIVAAVAKLWWSQAVVQKPAIGLW